MKLQRPAIGDKIAQITLYQQKSLDELRMIKPLWAYGENADKMLDYALHPKNQEYVIFHVYPSELVRSTEFYEVSIDKLFTGVLLNDSRVAGILNRWDWDEFVDPPTVDFCVNFKGKLSLSDGRHRTKITFLLGHIEMPIAIHNTEIEQISNIINLNKIEG
ncbi:hypothetical protein [Mucilaginibacter sp.]|jgi:hypothetical protein|uniref:hypothetical protein n=1 Tax=Mucilaginibacter sp. TaxID=1882438 RepID=UPI00356599D3